VQVAVRDRGARRRRLGHRAPGRAREGAGELGGRRGVGLINISTAVHTVTDSRGTERVTNQTDCGLVRFARPTALDVVWVGDATGAVAEVRIWRAPCQAVYAGPTGDKVPTTELLSRLDSWLGRGARTGHRLRIPGIR
jgi:hypothetical protein